MTLRRPRPGLHRPCPTCDARIGQPCLQPDHLLARRTHARRLTGPPLPCECGDGPLHALCVIDTEEKA